MALELPGYAIPAFGELNLPWPGIDEDQLSAWATSVRAYADDLSRNSGRVRRAVSDLAEESRSSFTNALAAYWGQQGQLINGLNGALDAFAAALDTAASQVVTQKQGVINAAIELASQLTAPQAPPANPPVAEQAAQAARAQQISQARQTVSAVLQSLEADLSGPLLNVAVPQVTDYANGLADSLRADAVPAAGAVGTLRLSYSSLHQTAQTIRSQAGATGKSGESAYAHNANRDLRDQGSGIGDPVGDGGSWQSVLQSVELALGDVASVLFTITSEAISHYQKVTANALDKFADEVGAADARERVHDHTAARDSQFAFKIQENAGAKAASQFLTQLKSGQTSDTVFFAQLRAHENDPGWQTGAMRALGSAYLYYLVCEGHIPAAGKGEPKDANIKALALAVAAAMAHGVSFPTAMVDGAAAPANEAMETDSEAILAPLLQYANFPPRVLATLAYEATVQGDTGGDDPYAPAIWTALTANRQALKLFAGHYANLPAPELAALGRQAMTYTDPSAPPPTVIWAALAGNPKAAALFVAQNGSAIPAFVSGGDTADLPSDQVNLFAAVLKSGTIGAEGLETGREDADGVNLTYGGEAVQALVSAYSNDQGSAHAPSQIQALYGQITEAYWPDLRYALVSQGASVTPGPGGVALNQEQWAAFMDEAMRDPQTSARLLVFGHAQAYQLLQQAGQQPSGQNPQTAQDAGSAYLMQAGTIDGFFDYQAVTVYSELSKEDANAGGAWKSAVADGLVNAALLAAPGPEVSIPLTLAADLVLPMINQVLDPPGSNGSGPPQLSSTAFYQELVIAYYNAATPADLASNPTLRAVSNSAKRAQGVSFLNANGKIVSRMSPKQLYAFNLWVSAINPNAAVSTDPAVAGYFGSVWGLAETAYLKTQDEAQASQVGQAGQGSQGSS